MAKRLRNNGKIIVNNFTFEDWLDVEEKGKLIRALQIERGYTQLAIVKDIDTHNDIYYINGVEIFKRKIR